MKKLFVLLIILFSYYSAYSQVYVLKSSVFGGGGPATGGTYKINGSTAQPNVGLAGGGAFGMKIGFWHGFAGNLEAVVTAPNIQASNITFSNITRTSMNVSWTRGNGDHSILLARQQYRIPAAPLTDDVVYTANSSSYTNGLNSTVGGAKVLYNGTSASPNVSVTNLTRYQLVYFKVCEYNNDVTPKYLQSESSTNPRSRWTLRRDGLLEEDLTMYAEYAYPNPARNSVSVTLDVFEAGTVSAYLYDIQGKQVAELYNKQLGFGFYDLKMDLSSIPDGAYQLVLSKGSEAVVYPLSVVK